MLRFFRCTYFLLCNSWILNIWVYILEVLSIIVTGSHLLCVPSVFLHFIFEMFYIEVLVLLAFPECKIIVDPSSFIRDTFFYLAENNCASPPPRFYRPCLSWMGSVHFTPFISPSYCGLQSWRFLIILKIKTKQ